MSEELIYPDLYAPGNGANVRLLGMVCGACGHVAFPRQRYGCEKCGADATSLQNVDLDAAGTLASYATVHMHQAKTIVAPFVIGEIRLDRGPTIRSTMVEPSDQGLCIGARVLGRLVPAPSADGGVHKMELRFTMETPS